ncbi:MAG: hypothetical protein OXU36_10565 [Candidatus Poribacteria bacterium]|nr:hypothetical protein [Candidatus Poribacteria bacterium]
MTIQEHIKLLQGIHRDILGIKYAPNFPEPDLEGKVPAIIVQPAAGSMYAITTGENSCLEITQRYRTTLFYDKVGNNLYGKNISEMNEILSLMFETYHKTNIEGFDSVIGNYPYLAIDEANPITHSGATIIAFNSNDQYTACDISIPIVDQYELDI